MNKRAFILIICCASLVLVTSCQRQPAAVGRSGALPEHPIYKPLAPNASPKLRQLIEGATAQAGVTTSYSPAYVRIAYPNGDVDLATGVCSDVVVRAFRKAGIDLQKDVHEDMLGNFSLYPQNWNLAAPDANIDHRRVLNLMTYFQRHGKSLSVTANSDDYLPGDVVAWDLGGGHDHIGIVSNMWSESEHRCLIVHNIGAGTRVEDVMFNRTIKGHYRYFQ